MAKLLVRHGLTLRQAHRVLNRLATGESVPVEVPHVTAVASLIAQLDRLAVSAEHHLTPKLVDIKKIRARLGMSQADFAALFPILKCA